METNQEYLDRKELVDAIEKIVMYKDRFLVVVLGNMDKDCDFNSALSIKGYWSINSIERCFELSKEALMSEIGERKEPLEKILEALNTEIEELDKKGENNGN